MPIDHLMWGASDLQRGIEEMERLTGVRAAIGGPHPGQGTCNALLSFEGGDYLEIIAPDPQQDKHSGLATMLAGLSNPGLVTWAARSNDLAKDAAALEAAGFQPAAPMNLSRTTPSGETLEWQIMFIGGHKLGGLVPFLIDWKDAPHPANNNPKCGTLTKLSISAPDPEPLKALIKALDLQVETQSAEKPSLSATVQTPKGELILAPLDPIPTLSV